MARQIKVWKVQIVVWMWHIICQIKWHLQMVKNISFVMSREEDQLLEIVLKGKLLKVHNICTLVEVP